MGGKIFLSPFFVPRYWQSRRSVPVLKELSKMRLAKIATVLTIMALAACATSNRAVLPGVNTIGSLQVTAGNSWNSAPSKDTPASRSASRTWTQDGLLLDRLMLIPGIRDGESVFESPDKSAALPVFKVDMLPSEIEELIVSSIAGILGESGTVAGSANSRPQMFGDLGGHMFDLVSSTNDGADQRGMVGTFVTDDRLYVVAFLAQEPENFEKHRQDVETLIKSATTTRPTIGRY